MVEMRFRRSPQAVVMTETRGPVKTGPLVRFLLSDQGLPELLGLDELPRRAACLRLEDRDEAALRVAVFVERHRADDAVGDVRLEHLRDDVLAGAVGAADRVREHL